MLKVSGRAIIQRPGVSTTYLRILRGAGSTFRIGCWFSLALRETFSVPVYQD